MPSSVKTRPTLLIGIGNEFRSDDGVGILAARRIREMNLPRVVVIEHSGECMALIDAWSGAETVIIIDAVSSQAPPGTIHRLDARRQSVPQELFPFSTHEFGLAQAVELARSIGRLPVNLVIYGMEGKNFHAGSSLSPEIQEALDELTQLLIGEIFSFSENSTGKDPT